MSVFSDRSQLLDHIDYLTGVEARLDARVDELIGPFSWARDLLVTIPGIQARNAETIIAEIGVDMTRFPSAAHLASWAGMCPGNNESAGKHRSGRTRKGDPWLQATLVEAAWAASRTKDSSMRARFYRLSKRRGYERAIYAVGHHLLVVIWWMLTERVPYSEMGQDYQTRRVDPERRRRFHVDQLEALGYQVQLTSAA